MTRENTTRCELFVKPKGTGTTQYRLPLFDGRANYNIVGNNSAAHGGAGYILNAGSSGGHGTDIQKWFEEHGMDNLFNNANPNSNSDHPNEIFYFDDLKSFVYNTSDDNKDNVNMKILGTADTQVEANEACLKSGDTLYLYYLAGNTTTTAPAKSAQPISAVTRVAAAYSNNPNEVEPGDAAYDDTKPGVDYTQKPVDQMYQMGITPISECNINRYSLKVNVKKDTGDILNNSTSLRYALYTKDSDGKKAYASFQQINSTASNVVVRYFDANQTTSTTTGGGSFPYYVSNPSNSNTFNFYWLPAGTYYLEELQIGTVDGYKLAKQPIKLEIGNEYNKNQPNSSYTLTTDGTYKTLVNKLTVNFKSETTDNRITATIVRPAANPAAGKAAAVTEVVRTLDLTEENNPIYATTTKLDGDAGSALIDGLIEVDIIHNPSGIELPETGGIGTVIFFVVGGAIVLAAVVLIVTRIRIKHEKLYSDPRK